MPTPRKLLAALAATSGEEVELQPKRKVGPLVPPEGYPDAPIAVIGESPGREEAHLGRPFVGPAGRLLERVARSNGLERTSLYITNVCKEYRGPTSDSLKPTEGELKAWSAALLKELAAGNHRIIVPMGNTALRALTGKEGIMKWRGSLLWSEALRCTVIPTLHPAFLLRQPSATGLFEADWRRIAAEPAGPPALPQRQRHIAPALADLERYFAELGSGALSLDIETTLEPEPLILCIAFSKAPGEALCIPTTLAYWRSKRALAEAWQWIAALCASRNEKVLQNGLYDSYWLAWQGIPLSNWRWDTLAMHHCLAPSADRDLLTDRRKSGGPQHSLAVLGSLYTREPYWKDKRQWAGRPADEALWLYCCTDAAATFEIKERLERELAETGLLPFYLLNYPQRLNELLKLSLTGLRLDRKAWESATLRASAELQAATVALAATGVVKQKGISPQRLAEVLYEEMGLPEQHSRKTKRVTTDKGALKRLALKSEEARSVTQQVERFRTAQKRLEFLDKSAIDADGRLRATFNPFAETGRLRSSENPRGTGRNLQNIARPTKDFNLRSLVLPELGHLILEVDLIQIEDRIVRCLTHSKRQLEIAQAPPGSFDAHRDLAAKIFHCASSAVTKEQRDLGKRGRHASNYDMHERTFQAYLAAEGVFITLNEARRILTTARAEAPEIAECYHRDTRILLAQERCLTNSWGRQWRVPYDRLDDDLFRRGYAWRPQSEPPEIIMNWAQLPLRHLIARELGAERCLILNNGHDSLIVSIAPSCLWQVASFLFESLERKRFYGDDWFIPYCELKVGLNWGEMKEWKRLPPREELEAFAQEALQ